jgi:polar amino acid transport system ATP-binding protein
MSAGEAETVISIVDVEKSYGSLSVLRGVSLEVGRGQVVALMGSSGSGKSTLLRCINHLETIDAGRIVVNGQLIGYRERGGRLYELSDREVSRQRRGIGMVFQNFNLFRHMTALSNVSLGLEDVLRLPKIEARERAMAQLEAVGLADKAGSYPAELSGGQQQRVAIARALAMEPNVLLLDEPTSALDPELAQGVISTIRELATGCYTMLIATHEVRVARELANRMAFMDDGRVLEQGAPEELLARPTARLKQFLAQYETNSQ